MLDMMQDGFQFTSILYPFNEKRAIKIVKSSKSYQQYQDYINKNQIEQAEIIMPDLKIVLNCPSLKYLRISPSEDREFDFSLLYQMPHIKSLHCQNQYGSQAQYISDIDFSKINGLHNLSICINRGTQNYNKVQTLKSLSIGNYKGADRNLSDLFCSPNLDTLTLNGCFVYSLNGIETSNKMQCVYLYRNRALTDITALRGVKNTLKALRIENCPKIQDFSVLGELENLELLELSGSNTLPNLNFLKSMKNLKTFVFNMNVLDGDLSPCLNLSYVYSEKNRKHYNLKDAELPKGEYIRGNENIEEWRRLE